MANVSEVITGTSLVEHFAGARLTRRTWRGAVIFPDGTRKHCQHSHGHRTVETAESCARLLLRKLER